jgi:hypothetical protein
MRLTYLAMLLPGFVLIACASTPHNAHWEKAGATSADFAADNQSCGARASRMKPTPRPDQVPGGAVAPNNRMDAPPRPWTSAVAEAAYMECMRERGWRVEPAQGVPK